MRQVTNKEKIRRFMRVFAQAASQEVRVYFTGGTTAVLFGWRETTVDVDLRFEPELDELYRSIATIKEELEINVEYGLAVRFHSPITGMGNALQIHRPQRKSELLALRPVQSGFVQDRARSRTGC